MSYMPILVSDTNTFEQWRQATNQIVNRLNLLYNTQNVLDVDGSASIKSNTSIGGTFDVSGVATFSSSVDILGDLKVKGTTTTVNSEVVTVKDKMMTLSWNHDDPHIFYNNLVSGIEVNLGIDSSISLGSSGDTSHTESGNSYLSTEIPADEVGVFIYDSTTNTTKFRLDLDIDFWSSDFADYSKSIRLTSPSNDELVYTFVVETVKESQAGGTRPQVIVQGDASGLSGKFNYQFYDNRKQFYWDQTKSKWVIDSTLQIQGDIESEIGKFDQLVVGNKSETIFETDDVTIFSTQDIATQDRKPLRFARSLSSSVYELGSFGLSGGDGVLFLEMTDGALTSTPLIKLHPTTNSFIKNGLGVGIESPTSLFQVKSPNEIAETVAEFGNLTINNGLQIVTDGNLQWGLNALNERSLTFSTNQIKRMIIDEDGKVGIGTTSPFGSLEVMTDGDGTEDGIILRSSSEGGRTLRLWATGDKAHIGSGGGTEDLILNHAGGNVGIGTTSPSSKLDINTGAMSGSIKIGNFDNVDNLENTDQFGEGTKIEFIADTNPKYSEHVPFTVAYVKAEYDGTGADTKTGDSALTFATYDGWRGSAAGVLSEKMRISSSGNVGIGTTSPDAKLEIEVPTGIGNTNLLGFRRDGGYGNSGFNQYYNSASGSDPILWGLNFGLNVSDDTDGKVGIKFESGSGPMNFADDKIIFRTANSDKVVIDDNGNVGIGITSPTEKLEVDGAIKIGDTNTASLGTIKYDPNDQALYGYVENNGITQWVNLVTGNPAGGGSTTTSWTKIVRSVSETDVFATMTEFDVGIGTQNPDRKLDVQEDRAGNYAARIQNVDATGSGLQIVCDNTTSSSSYIFACEKSGSTSPQFPFVVKGDGNVGIGTTTPHADLHIHTSGDGTTKLQLTDGISGSGTHDGLIIGMDADQNGYLWQHENTDIKFGTNNTEKMRLDSAGTLNLNSANNNKITLNDNSSYWLATGPSENWGIYWNTQDNKIEFHANGVNNWNVDLDSGSQVMNGDLSVDGGVKVGFTSSNDANTAGTLRWKSDVQEIQGHDGNQWFTIGKPDWDRITTAGSDYDKIYYNDAFVGVGTNSPQARLHVDSGYIRSEELEAERVLITASNKDIMHSDITTEELNQLDGINTDETIQSQLNTLNAGNWSPSLNNTGIYRNSNVGVGDFSATELSEKLEIRSTSGDNFIKIKSTSEASDRCGIIIERKCLDTNNNWIDRDYELFVRDNGDLRLRQDSNTIYYFDDSELEHVFEDKVKVNSSITATGDIESTSDISIKENLEIIENPIEKIKELNGYTFNKNGEEKRSAGLVAQEVEKVLPEVVSENSDGIKSLAYGNIVALLVETVKEQQKQIDELKQQLSNK